MQNITITLTTAGASTGPFDIYTDDDGYATPIETGIAKVSFLTGYTSSVVPDGATVIRLKSTGDCTNYVDFPIL